MDKVLTGALSIKVRIQNPSQEISKFRFIVNANDMLMEERLYKTF